MSRQKTRKSIGSHKTIDQHWKNKLLTENGWADTLGDLAFEVILEDEGEHCYACAIPCRTQKAHIVPHALGGSEKPDNIFLLCDDCHRENPDTIYPDMFYRHIRETPHHLVRMFKNVEAISKIYEKATDDEKMCFDAVVALDSSTAVKEIMLERINREPQAIGAHGKWSEKTKVALVWKNCLAVGAELLETTSVN